MNCSDSIRLRSLISAKQGFKQGVDSLGRILQVSAIIRDVLRKKNNSDAIYLIISASIAGNLKDIFIYLVCFNRHHKMIVHLHGGSIKILLFDKIKLFFSYCLPLLRSRYSPYRFIGAAFIGTTVHGLSYGNWVSPFYLYIVAVTILYAAKEAAQCDNIRETLPTK